ncbi:hypothetical protein B0T21DRAFT_377347 [Apiosordaria backusii]|uniref:Uncharacterized protein n=1 Tax=Apiosordaria backusii TaxID=314023 RepID=A0AA40A0W0_9PEZI|nr:hypothetical protein B0T21DRAFT_377347 [Apiosordaria backusii]
MSPVNIPKARPIFGRRPHFSFALFHPNVPFLEPGANTPVEDPASPPWTSHNRTFHSFHQIRPSFAHC